MNERELHRLISESVKRVLNEHEDDWFEDSSNTMIIEKHELVEKVQEMKAIVQGTSIEYWNNIYDEFISRLD